MYISDVQWLFTNWMSNTNESSHQNVLKQKQSWTSSYSILKLQKLIISDTKFIFRKNSSGDWKLFPVFGAQLTLRQLLLRFLPTMFSLWWSVCRKVDATIKLLDFVEPWQSFSPIASLLFERLSFSKDLFDLYSIFSES